LTGQEYLIKINAVCLPLLEPKLSVSNFKKRRKLQFLTKHQIEKDPEGMIMAEKILIFGKDA
jgi:hypothetical protein